MSIIQSHVKAVDEVFWRKGRQGHFREITEIFFLIKKISHLKFDHNKSKIIFDRVRRDWMSCTSKIQVWRLVDAKHGNKKT